MLFLVFALVVSIVLAHFVAQVLVGSLEVEPGHIREVMPTVPVAPLEEGDPDQRWGQAVRRVEGRLLEKFRGGATGVTAEGLAADLGENRRVIAGALERMREEVDCRIRVTRSGTMLHDFEADQIEKLEAERTRSIPMKLFMFGVAAAANIGAIWPVLAILFLAVASLQTVAQYANGAEWGAYGIGMIVVIFGATLILSWILHFLMHPLMAGPSLGPMETSEQIPDRRSSTSSGDSWGGIWFFGGGHSHGSSGDGGFDGDGDGLGQAIVVIILIAIIVLCVITVYVWLRGLWRAIRERDERELDRISPAFWVRTADVVDSFEKWVPTNDLVGRAVRALRRKYAHRRPVDGDLGPRTLARAKRRGGVVSALEVALEEGLDISEATEVGAELCSIVGGEIIVNDSGELGFSFPDRVLAEVDEDAGMQLLAKYDADSKDEVPEQDRDPEELDHLWAEYLSFDDENPPDIERRRTQPATELPVNLVGLGWGHIQALDRLVGGTWIMAAMGSYLALWGPPASLSGYLQPFDDTILASAAAFPYVTTCILLVMAVGATCLSAATHYTANVCAVHGVRRDARRAAFHIVDAALERGRDQIEFGELTDAVVRAFESSWREIDRELVEAELRGVLVDLEIGYDLNAAPEEAGEAIDLRPLHERWTSVREEGFETVFGEEVAAEPGAEPAEDEVVFDTQVEHDHVTALA